MTASRVARRRACERRGPVSNAATVPSAPSMSPTWARSSTERRSAGGLNVTRTTVLVSAGIAPRPLAGFAPRKMRDVSDRLVQQRGDVLVVQRIDPLPPMPLGDDQTILAQYPQ